MSTTITFNLPADDESKPIIQTHVERQYLLRPPTKIFKALPPTIIQSIEADRRQRQVSRSSADIFSGRQSSIDNTDDELDATSHSPAPRKQTRPKLSARVNRSPSDVRVTLYPERNLTAYESLTHSQSEVSDAPRRSNDHRQSDPSLVDDKTSKPSANEQLRRTILEHRFGRRIHSSFSSSTTLRSLSRRRSTQTLSPRQSNSSSRNRRHVHQLPRNSKWHLVRQRLPEIAMMSESYARMKTLEQDLRWSNLREKIQAQLLDMREMNLLRQQHDGVLPKKKTQKIKFDVEGIPADDIVHVERDGQVYSMTTRDLVLGRLLDASDIQLDTFAQLDARRQFRVQQNYLKQQEGRTRLKKHIAFSFCLCNLSFIVLMFAAMFIFATNTILEMRAKMYV